MVDSNHEAVFNSEAQCLKALMPEPSEEEPFGFGTAFNTNTNTN